MNFWTVFRADLLFGICYGVFTCLLYVAYAFWRKRKFSRAQTKVMSNPNPPPRALIIGGQKEAVPGHCPLCGQLWHLPGPEKQ